MRKGSVFFFLLFLCMHGLPAWATQIQDLKINEICPVFSQGVADYDPGAWVEFYNGQQSNVSTAGLIITDAGLNVIATFPMIILPPRAYLLVHLGEGTDDFDASDGLAVHYVGHTDNLRFKWEGDAIALFRGGVQAANIRDFVAWGVRPLQGAPAMQIAVNRGIWRDGAYVNLSQILFGSSFGLAISGLDRDADSPWAFFTNRYDSGIWTPGQANILNAFPRPGEIILGGGFNGTLPASWVSTDFITEPTSYLVTLWRDEGDGSWTEVFSEETTQTSAVLPVPAGGTYAWRVDPCENGVPTIEGDEKEFHRAHEIGLRSELTVPFLRSLKDTYMICCYDVGTGTRPGCGPDHWRFPHTPGGSNSHDVFYSARAGIAMINNYYGGNLSQDRISYEVFRTRYPGAEGDLGHGRGFQTTEITNTLRWALGGISTSYGSWAPPFDYLRSQLDAGKPVLITTTAGNVNREAAVIAGYAILSIYDEGPPMPAVKVLDPRTGAEYWTLYSFYAPSIIAYWALTAPPTGRQQETAITIDTDNDGVVDFDETPQYGRFGSSSTRVDTDGDFIADLAEIYCYTFHETMNQGLNDDPPGFSDVDNDGLRAEADYDSDNGGRHDGLEDLNWNGIAPEQGETDPYDPADDPNAPPYHPMSVDELHRSALRLVRMPVERLGDYRFRVDLPAADRVSVTARTIEGRACAVLLEGTFDAGSYDVAWDGVDRNGTPVASGIYMIRLETGAQGARSAKVVHVR